MSVRVAFRCVPNAGRSAVVRADDGSWRLRIDAPPVDGKANKRATRFLARSVFHVSGSQIRLVAGKSGRNKVFEIDLPKSEVLRLLEAALHAR